MNNNIKRFVIDDSADIYDAGKKIDDNKCGFVIVIDDTEKLVGVLTDGDIRRGLLRGCLVNDSIEEIYTKKPQALTINSELEDAIEIFKNQAIKFLPIVDDNEKLINIITKNQMHAVLLQDIHADLSYDFTQIDIGIIDHEIFQRPWGFYKTTVLNDFYQAKVISVKPGGQLSLQSHNHREEYWIVVHGTGTVQLDKSVINVNCGSTVFIPKGTKHRLINTDEKESLIITEVQLGDYLGEDDIIRYEDIYGRV